MFSLVLEKMKYTLLQDFLLKLSATYLLFGCAVGLVIIFRYRRRHYYKFARKVIGPPQWPLIGCARLRYTGPHELMCLIHQYYYDYRATGERLVQTFFGDKFLIFPLDAAYTNFFLTKFLVKTDLYKITSNLFRDGVLGCPPIAKWRRDRKMIAPTFGYSVVKSYISIFFDESNLLVQKLRPFVVTGGSFYPEKYLNSATFNMVIRSTLGANPRAQDHDEHPAIKAMMDILDSIMNRLVHPLKCRDFFSNLMGYNKTEQGFEKILRDFYKDMIRGRASDDSFERSSSFAAHMMKNNMDEEELITHVVNVVFAGTDTTTTANFAALLMLGLHPEVQDKAYQEVISILGSDRSKEPSFEDLQSMVYVERIIKECLRLYPPVPLVGRQICSDHDKVDDLELPRGAHIVMDLYALHRDPNIFTNPNQFEPDRFLPAEAAKRPIGSYVPFLVGSRDCIGRKYAMLQMKTVVSTMLRHYRILPAPSCASMEEVVLEIVATSKFSANCQIRLEPREVKAL